MALPKLGAVPNRSEVLTTERCAKTSGQCQVRVRGRKALSEYMFSELPLTADIVTIAAKHVSKRSSGVGV